MRNIRQLNITDANVISAAHAHADRDFLQTKHNAAHSVTEWHQTSNQTEGVVCEIADSKDLFHNPLHPYIQSLLAVVPRLRVGEYST